MKKAKKPQLLCIYCRKGTVKKLPAKCPECGCKLSEPVTPKMPLRRLSDLAFGNGLRWNFSAVPIEKQNKS
jgi:hypothetical protein